MNNVSNKLTQLAELDAQLEIIRLDKQTAIDSVLTDEVKAQLAEIDMEFDLMTEAITNSISIIENDVKTMVIEIGETVKSDYTAVYNEGRESWDTKGLDGYAVANPEIKQFKKKGNPYVSIRRK